jgi:hypothetical protein
MLRKFALGLAVAGALGVAALASSPAGAAPAAPGFAPTIEADVEVVRHRRCHLRRSSRWVPCPHYYRPYYRPYYGPYWGPPWPAPWPFWPFFPFWP